MAEKVVAALLVVLCVVALALSAAALSSDALERGPGEGSGPGSSDDPMPQPQQTNETVEEPPSLLPPWVLQAVLGLLLVLAIPGLVLSGWSRVAGMVLGALFFVALVAAIMLLSGEPIIEQPMEVMEPNGTEPGAEGGGELGSADESRQDDPQDPTSLLTYGVLGLILVAAVGLVFYASNSVDDTTEPDRTTEDADGEPGDVGAAAGRAADRIEAADEGASNAVYDAWREMTGVLPVAAPETTTPGEFASAAVDAGMDPDDVAELTALFEAVRYGDAPPSAERERRAVDALRRIEAAYEAEDADMAVPEASAGEDAAEESASDSDGGDAA